jgi:hypothetical protein
MKPILKIVNKKAFLKERRKSNLGNYSIHYPPNPTCYLLQNI